MLCLGRMFLNLLEAHLLALLSPKQCAAGKRCFSLGDDSFALLSPKQCAAGKRCFSWQMTYLHRCRRWFYDSASGEWLCRDFCVSWPHEMAAKIYRKHSACGMKFVESCHEGCLKKLPPHKSEGASLTWMSFYLLNQMLITTEID